MTDRPEEAPGWRFATYLGDAVYALSEDGQSVHLRLDHHNNDRGEIFLEPWVLEALDRFRLRMAGGGPAERAFHGDMP